MKPNILRFMDRGDHSGYSWHSRDYVGFNPSCKVSYCPMNKYGKCELPAQIDIRADGRCQKAVDFYPVKQ